MAITKASAQTTVNSGTQAAAAATVNQITTAPATATVVAGGGSLGGVTISNVSIMSNAFANASVLSGDTAVSTAGGFVKITGTGFKTAANVFLGSTVLANTFVSATQINANIPASSAATYQFTVFNTDGSGAIYSPGLTISGPPSWTTTSYSVNALNLGNIQLLASGDAPLTYYIQPGSANPQNLAVNSAGYLSGTVSAEGAYTITVIVDDAQGQSTQADITVTISVSDVYFNRTTVALPADTTTWVTDASTNAYVLTVNGDTRPSAFSPYKTVWSNSFDGTGDYLTIPANAAFNFGTGDFTIECFYYRSGIKGNSFHDNIIGNRPSSLSSGQWHLYVGPAAAGAFSFTARTPSGDVTVTGGTCIENAWNHLAVVKNGTALSLFVNGISVNSTTTSTSIGDSVSNLSIAAFNDSAYPTIGYISSVRILKGTAVYTSTFTPPTSPLTAIANTSLLTCQSNRLIDNSTNNFTLTRNGDVSVSNFAPFVETDTTTASGYFDGLSDNIRKAGSGVLVANGDVTIECWMYPLSASITGIFDGGPSAVNIIRSYGTNKISKQGQEATGAAFTPIVNAWQHFAVTFSNGNIVTYINGVQSGTGTYTSGYDAGSNFDIGGINAGGDGNFPGYISNFRVVRALVYTGTFTPPTAPLTAIANTSLLTLQYPQGENNHRFVDESTNRNLITRNGNATQGSFSPFSPTGWSGYFTGASTSYITTPATSLLDQGQTYTVQCWIYPTTFTTSTSAVRRMYIFIKGVIYAGLSIHSDGTLGWYGWPTPAGMIVTSAAGTITTNVWQHVALVVNPSGNTIKLFKNGVEVGSAAYTAAGAGNAAIQIGHGDTGQGADGFIGYISNFKVTLSALTGGQLDYSATPTISSPAGAALLVLQTNRFNDTSANAFSITNGGVTSVQAFSPFAPGTEYLPATHSGSGYFDGTGDYLSIPNNSALKLTTGDWTIEFWMYCTGAQASSNNAIWTQDDTGGFTGIIITANSSRQVQFTSSQAGSAWNYLFQTFGTYTDYTWNHVAVTKSGSTVRGFFNGVLGLTINSFPATIFSGNYASVLGVYASSAYFNGYISNFRIVKGTAVYTAAFTPPTAPVTATANTSLLLNFTNAGVVDATAKNFFETVGGARVSTAISKFGGSSVFIPDTGNYIQNRTNYDVSFGSGDFTIEAWIYWNSLVSESAIMHGDGVGWTFYIYPANRLQWGTTSPQSPANLRTGNTTLATGQWYHIAVTRSGTTVTMWVNGVSDGTVTDSNNYSAAGKLRIGTSHSNYGFNGYMDDIRITKGFARYTATFTPPTATFKLR